MQEQRVELDGEVVYHDYGGDGPPLVLVHGLGGSALNWMSAAPLLTRHARVVAVDLLGHGKTSAAGSSAAVSDNHELLDRFLDAVIGESAVLAGNSMGGLLVMMEAAESPERVAGLVLVDPVMPQWADVVDPVVGQLFRAYFTPGVGEQFLRSSLDSIGPAGLVDQMLLLTYHDPSRIAPELREAHLAQVIERQETPEAIDDFLMAARSMLELVYDVDRWRDVLQRITAPTLLVHGADDRLVSVVAARELAALRPDWTLQVMKDVGHVPMMEDPEGFTTIVAAWLARLPVQRPAIAG
jgi:pimeloyl-ACP methyl ester carboxylesterase